MFMRDKLSSELKIKLYKVTYALNVFVASAYVCASNKLFLYGVMVAFRVQRQIA